MEFQPLDTLKKCLLTEIFSDLTSSPDLQVNLNTIINDEKSTEIVGMIFEIIGNEQQDEHNRGVKLTLLRLILHDLECSKNLWNKMIQIVSNPSKFATYKHAFDSAIKIKCVFNKIIEGFELYFKSLIQINNTFVIDVEYSSAKNIEKFKFFNEMELQQFLILLRYLLNHEDVAKLTTDRILNSSIYSSEFIAYLKKAINILNI
jgi:hypothetical protein